MSASVSRARLPAIWLSFSSSALRRVAASSCQFAFMPSIFSRRLFEPYPAKLCLERVQVVPAGRVQLEGPADQRTLRRIDGLRLPASAVEVTHRRGQGQDALL